jgi:hypothetical protein
MKKNKSTKQLKIEYEKVFESPLDWCPLFGYLPEVEEYATCDDKDVVDTIEACLDVINFCRENFGLDYRPAFHMRKYVCLPDIKTMLPCADNDNINYFRALRNLFSNLDFILLKTASLCDVSPLITNAINKGIRETKYPVEPIGRVSNSWRNGHSVIAEDIKLDRVFWRDSFLLEEVNKYLGDIVKLDNIKLISLYAILEAWLIVTGLLYKPWPNKEDLLYYIKRLTYAKELKGIAEHHNDIQHLSGVFNESQIIFDENKILQDSLEYIETTTARTPKKQRLYADAKHKKAKPILNDRNNKLIDAVKAILEGKKQVMSYQRIYNKLSNNEETKKLLTVKIRQFSYIIAPVLKEYKAKHNMEGIDT